MHTWPFTTSCGFHERQVVENKDRFLEGAEFQDDWEKYLEEIGVEKQKRVTYRERPDYRDRLGAFSWDLPEDTHSDAFTGNRASVKWLEEYDGQKPFFLEVGFPGPHPPYDPPPRFLELYENVDVPVATVSKEDLDGQPKAYKGMRTHNVEIDHDSVVHQLEPTDENRIRQRKHYLANGTLIDVKVGQIMKTLEEKGILENTIVIFSSDHGDCLTDHGHSQKWTMYDEITRVPLVVRCPSRFQGGRKIDDLVQLMDLGPAILEMAGEHPETMEAQSILPALEEDASWTGREYALCRASQGSDPHRHRVHDHGSSKDWKLVHFLMKKRDSFLT